MIIPDTDDPTVVYQAFEEYAERQGLTLYPAQQEAMIEIVSGANVILGTPTGSGKSLVAVGAHLAALARDEVTFYTAPIKALVSEKFFALCDIFGTENVGMLTGDAGQRTSLICCTAEILANIALRGADADVGQVVMDEFAYAGPDRGWAWRVRCWSCRRVLLMSATLSDVSQLKDSPAAPAGYRGHHLQRCRHFQCALPCRAWRCSAATRLRSTWSLHPGARWAGQAL